MGPYTVLPGTACAAVGPEAGIPDYLNVHYWWAYVHPRAVRLFERQWLVNLILWGNFARLRDARSMRSATAPGRTLQVACVYGDLTPLLSDAPPAAAQVSTSSTSCRCSSRTCRASSCRRPTRHADLRRQRRTSAPQTRATTVRCCSSCCTSSRRMSGADARERSRGEARRAIVIVDYDQPRGCIRCATCGGRCLRRWSRLRSTCGADLTELLAEAPAAEVRASSFFGGALPQGGRDPRRGGDRRRAPCRLSRERRGSAGRRPAGEALMKVALFIPCYIDAFFPEVGIATLELLERCGLEVDYPLDQTCCGQPMANSGCHDDAAGDRGAVRRELRGLRLHRRRRRAAASTTCATI